jgi:putative protease
MNTKKPELLAPAGNFEKLKVAVHYGADAVYLGGPAFGLRNLADNFTISEFPQALAHAHERGVKVYLTVNSYPGNDQLPSLRQYLSDIAHLPFDAYIAADPGVISIIRDISPDRDIHLSTQANTTNYEAARFWERQGITRINLAREMSREAIEETRKHTKIELEVFVHGAMCVSFSGRCLLSSIMTGRNANQGECAHPCRWNYSIMEEKRPGEYFPIVEEGGNTFIFNSKDLCLLAYLPQLRSCGVNSLKIEGRMKGISYLASVLRVYREAVDQLWDHPESYSCNPQWLDELSKISHRGYTTGFFLGPPGSDDHEYHSCYRRSHQVIGIIQEVLADGTAIIAVRNRICSGETVERIGPHMTEASFTMPAMLRHHQGQWKEATEANPNQLIRIPMDTSATPLDLLRRIQGNRADKT